MHIKHLAYALLFSAFLASSGCKDPLTPAVGAMSGVIYTNSFETPLDTAGWACQGSFASDTSVPPGGGLRSVRVSGGCIIPHASKKISTGPIAGKIAFRFWGRNLANGGAVELFRTADPLTRIQVWVTDTVWTAYQSAHSLQCSAAEELEIDMNSGGIVYGAMLVDSLTVFRQTE